MRIFMLNMTSRPTPEYGQIALHLRQSGHEVWQVTLDSDGNLLWDDGEGQPLEQKGPRRYPLMLPKARVFNILGLRLSQIGYIRRLRAKIREMQPDVVHFNNSGMRLACLLTAGLRRNRAFVLDFRQIGDRRRSTNLFRKVRNGIRTLTRSSSAKQCFDQSVYLHRLGAEKGLGSQWQRHGTVVPMGVDDAFLEVERQSNGRSAADDKVRFIYIGSMVRHRKLDTVFEAIKIVSAERDDFVVHFLGRDKSEGYFPALIEKLQIGPFVEILPLIPYEAVPQRLTQYDVALAFVPYEPTDWMQHPTLKILEYRAVGIPIIASDVPPSFDSVQDGRNGILCANTAQAYAAAMLRLIEDRQILEQIKYNAGQMREAVTWSEAAHMYEVLYNDLLAGRGIDAAQRTKKKTAS